MTAESALLWWLREPGAAQRFTVGDWHECLRDAQRNKLLSRLACQLECQEELALAPERIRFRLQGALHTAQGSRRAARWEVRKIYQALQPRGIPFVLLKGAAYELCGLPPATGRLYTDIDIMVRKEVLADAERALFEAGWLSTKIDGYDQRYYRQWMHEIPPLRHRQRGTSLDVHHTILPPTAAPNPDPGALWAAAGEVPGWPGMFVLGPADMVLHSAAHLFHDGDLQGGLRDLLDLDLLLRQFCREAQCWEQLLERAREHQLTRALYYALRYSARLLDTPVPARAMARAEVFAALPPLAQPLMDRMVMSALDPSRRKLDSRSAAFGRWLLYLRSHHLRMPLHLLLPHLARKAVSGQP